jgi:hypothetical protein
MDEKEVSAAERKREVSDKPTMTVEHSLTKRNRNPFLGPVKTKRRFNYPTHN